MVSTTYSQSSGFLRSRGLWVDAGRNSSTGRSPRIPGFTADRPLPVLGRQQATEGTGNVQGGVFTKPEAGQIVVHHVDTHFDADLIKIHIAGLRHGIHQVYPAMPGTLPVPVAST